VLTADEERALVARARAGHEDAFTDLVGEYRARTWSICLRLTGNHADAEDALQDALTAAWLNLHKFRSDARFGTWLHRIAANASLAVLRRRRDVPIDPHEHDQAHATYDPFVTVDDADRIQRALVGIPEVFRAALVLREYGDMSYDEIAAFQGVGVQTVKSRINRARRAVSAALVGQE
jgi:RNA polymerase sigma factor (sigma-70 family)